MFGYNALPGVLSDGSGGIVATGQIQARGFFALVPSTSYNAFDMEGPSGDETFIDSNGTLNFLPSTSRALILGTNHSNGYTSLEIDSNGATTIGYHGDANQYLYGPVRLDNTFSVWNHTPPVSPPSITGSRAGMAIGIYECIQALAAYGFVTDDTTA